MKRDKAGLFVARGDHFWRKGLSEFKMKKDRDLEMIDIMVMMDREQLRKMNESFRDIGQVEELKNYM